jgi:hypothetical protein
MQSTSNRQSRPFNETRPIRFDRSTGRNRSERDPLAEPGDAVEGTPLEQRDARRPPARPPAGRTDHPPAPKTPTARAMTRREVTNAAVACTPIRIFARLVNGIVSVGLNALEFVVDRYR